ncbi:MAG: sel1 repeat family protein, partial [Gammaproteobacteria bacterium]|nr:sel1 repeat family protein [Gammaproteobacteria bacterium]
AEAAYWYAEAGNQGMADAQFNLAQMYNEGDGVHKNQEAAVKWYRVAAEKGHMQAANNLAIRYALGEGVGRDDVQAYKWFNVAAELGDVSAVRHRERVAHELSPEQVVEAGKMAKEWLLNLKK